MSNSPTMAAFHTGVESSSKLVTRSVNSMTVDGLNLSKTEVAHSNSSLSADAKNSERRSSTVGGGEK
jgi:hypothetical protein